MYSPATWVKGPMGLTVQSRHRASPLTEVGRAVDEDKRNFTSMRRLSGQNKLIHGNQQAPHSDSSHQKEIRFPPAF
jgi:hypothetical protein